MGEQGDVATITAAVGGINVCTVTPVDQTDITANCKQRYVAAGAGDGRAIADVDRARGQVTAGHD